MIQEYVNDNFAVSNNFILSTAWHVDVPHDIPDYIIIVDQMTYHMTSLCTTSYDLDFMVEN